MLHSAAMCGAVKLAATSACCATLSARRRLDVDVNEIGGWLFCAC